MENRKAPVLLDVPLSKAEVVRRVRSLAALGIVVPLSAHLFQKSGSYADIFQYHPICMMLAFVMVMPDVVSGVKRLRQPREKAPRKGDSGKPEPLDAHLPRDEIIMRHQLASFVMEIAAAAGFGAVEYTKITKNYGHLKSPHAIVGALCGASILCQMMLGSTLRYVLPRASPRRGAVRAAHKYVSITISITGLMALAGGFLATEYAHKAIPSPSLRAGIVVASVATTVAGLLM